MWCGETANSAGHRRRTRLLCHRRLQQGNGSAVTPGVRGIEGGAAGGILAMHLCPASQQQRDQQVVIEN